MTIGGWGRWIGCGNACTPENETIRPSKAGRGCVQIARIAARYSSVRAPRSSNGASSASNSRSTYPTPTPNTSRPPDSTSTVASSFARTSGLRSGNTMMPVPSRTDSVRAARNASEVTGSRIGSAGSMFDGDRFGSGTTRCSETQIESIPVFSAASASRTSRSRVAYGPEFAEQTPIFTGVPPASGSRAGSVPAASYQLERLEERPLEVPEVVGLPVVMGHEVRGMLGGALADIGEAPLDDRLHARGMRVV